MKSLGEKISPILEEIEITLLENYETPPKFPIEGEGLEAEKCMKEIEETLEFSAKKE